MFRSKAFGTLDQTVWFSLPPLVAKTASFTTTEENQPIISLAFL